MGISIESEIVTIKEIFFVHTMVSTVQGLAELVSKWLVDRGLELCKIRGQ